jgi:Putative bacterial sensory transduction regulator
MNITKPVSIALGLALTLSSAVTPATAKMSVPRSVAAPAMAQSAPAGIVVTQLSNSQAAAVLKRMGFDYKPTEKEPSNFVFTLDGYKVVLLNYPNSIQLYAGFKSSGKVSLETINTWNREKRFSRAYIDGDNDAVIESDLDLEGGVSNKAIDEFIRTFRTSLRDFAKHAGV